MLQILNSVCQNEIDGLDLHFSRLNDNNTGEKHFLLKSISEVIVEVLESVKSSLPGEVNFEISLSQAQIAEIEELKRTLVILKNKSNTLENHLSINSEPKLYQSSNIKLPDSFMVRNINKQK